MTAEPDFSHELRDFARRGLGFAMMLAAIMLVLELVARQIFGPTISALKLELIGRALERESPQTIVLGNSRGFAGLDPTRLPGPALNMADNSRTVYYDHLMLKRLRPRLKSLKTVIIALDFFSLDLDRPENVLDYLSQGYPPRQGVTAMETIKTWSVLVRHRTYFPQELWASFTAPRRHLTIYQADEPPPDMPVGALCLLRNGWLALSGSVPQQMTPEFGLAQFLRHVSGADPALRPVLKGLLRDLVALAVESDVRVLLLVCPVSGSYRQWVEPAVLEPLALDLREIRSEHPDRVRVLWLYDAGGYPPQAFQNADHLNMDGARQLSDQVRAYLEEWEDSPEP